MRSIAPFPLAALCALAMVLSVFLPWMRVPAELAALFIGGDIGQFGALNNLVPLSPADLFALPGFDAEQLLTQPLGLAILGAMLLAAACAILGFLGHSVPRLFAILAGFAPFAITAWLVMSARSEIPADLPLPQISDFGQLSELTPFMGIGIYAYFGGALLLLILGVFSPRKRSASSAYIA